MIIYVAIADSLLVIDPDADPGSDDAMARVTLRRDDLECVAASSDRPDRLFVGTFDGGLLRSIDGGSSVERVGADVIESDAVTAARVSPHDPDEVWVGTEPSRVYRSNDGGETWTHLHGIADLPSEDEWYFPPRPYTHHVRWLEPNPADRSRWYVGIEAGALVQTRDQGETWEERPAGSRRDNHQLATHPSVPDRVWSAAGDGYAESHDAGDTWRHPQEGLTHRYCWSLAIDPGDPGTVLLSAASGAGAAHRRGESYLYRKRDGQAWERLADARIPTGEGVYRAVLSGGRQAGEAFAVNNHGCYRTADMGETWVPLDIDWPDRFADSGAHGLAVA